MALHWEGWISHGVLVSSLLVDPQVHRWYAIADFSTHTHTIRPFLQNNDTAFWRASITAPTKYFRQIYLNMWRMKTLKPSHFLWISILIPLGWSPTSALTRFPLLCISTPCYVYPIFPLFLLLCYSCLIPLRMTLSYGFGFGGDIHWILSRLKAEQKVIPRCSHQKGQQYFP